MSDKIIRKAMAKDGQKPGPQMQKFLSADKRADRIMDNAKKSITSGKKK